MSELCPCCSGKLYRTCCQPLHKGKISASSAEALMRSRYSAYALQQFAYVLHTYAKAQQVDFSLTDLAQDADTTEWLHLAVEASTANSVRFKAYYRVQNELYMLHELSEFVQEQGEWRYTTGDIQPDSGVVKHERNAVCFCGSGKKFKRCHG